MLPGVIVVLSQINEFKSKGNVSIEDVSGLIIPSSLVTSCLKAVIVSSALMLFISDISKIRESVCFIELKAALDSGHKVIIGFVIYDAAQKSGCKNGNVNGDSYFKYNTKTLVTSASNVSNKKDAWTRAYGCALGGHEVIVTSYFENEDGQLIFLIRNSWSDKSGDQGNYYMTGDYFNRAGMDGYEVYAIRNQ